MDIMMPKMDGLSACYAIKQNELTRHIPVVMLTAIGHELNQRLSQSVMGASGYITKPFSPDEVLSTVRAAECRSFPALSNRQTAHAGLRPVLLTPSIVSLRRVHRSEQR
jgi:DNA-binding response OmpR family regulator